jgi:hypothetical protein
VSYRMPGSMFIRRCWPWWWPMLLLKGNTILSGSAVVSDLLGARLKAVFSKLFRRLLRRPGYQLAPGLPAYDERGIFDPVCVRPGASANSHGPLNATL